MVKEVKWTKYLWLSLLSFGAFMLELLSIFAIEVIFLHVDIQNYTMQQRSIHCIIMVFMWAFFIGVLLPFSRKHYHFPVRGSKRDKISSKSWIIMLACFIGCKIMTFIDWHTLKIIGEAQNKTVFQFCAQYLYYIFEVMLVILIIIYGQKAIETLLKKESPIPFGGVILAMTWGAMHFVSRGVGLEIWNGISTMIFSILSGIMYLRLNRKCLYSYLFIAIGYLL
jgi:phosphate starvation-inducible membrane PsiE